MSEFNRYGAVSTMFENVLTYKPHVDLRHNLADPEQAEVTFADFVDEHRQYHPDVENFEGQMQETLVKTLDRLIGRYEYKIAKLQETLGGLVSRSEELKAIRSNFVIEEE